MKASYKKLHQRRLGLTHKELNKLDRKYNNINLLKKLQLKPAPAGATGWYGTFQLFNETAPGSGHRHINAYLAFNNTALTNSVQINGGTDHTFTISIANRLPLPSSTLQLKVTLQNGTDSVDLEDIDGFTITDFTDNPLDQENTLSMLVDSNNLNNGVCTVTFVVTFN